MAKKTDNPEVLKVTLIRSVIGRPPDQRSTVASLGLRRLHQTVEVENTPSNRGMLTKVRHLVVVEDEA
ncbi:MAG TPA: 50S ribosomal protein L30 [Thermomicrobiales bacterium]|jgi:large subunit ribosomal protein L30|nr:50S ribosomal protein L30 [Thermomicrobiales bacterium]